MTASFGRKTAAVAMLLGLGPALTGCGGDSRDLWGVDKSKTVQLPPSDYPAPDNNPPPKTSAPTPQQ
ncbi:hypothetical protein [Benzoatithermus flavus]|uniref:Lipoprotein n=1 Tax=Benzoatithermus flavus TaxID=3108223 RepID=A0ABU8XMX8_9PROT